MNNYLIIEYIKRLRKEDIQKFALKQDIKLEEDELNIIYNHIKNDYQRFINEDPKPILNQVKKEVKPATYNKIEELYEQFKDYLK